MSRGGVVNIVNYTEINGEETTQTPGRIRVEPPPVRLRN